MPPEISVVVPTRDRPDRLARQLAALRAQSLDPERFEIVVVDDASGPETAGVLARAAATGEGPALVTVRRDERGGPAAAGEDGWRAAAGRVIAFTHDDCEPVPQWLAATLRALDGREAAIVQGPVFANPAELGAGGTFARTVEAGGPGPWFGAANIAYPRELLERIGGFDTEAFPRGEGAETDLAWRAIEAGAVPVWSDDAVVLHAVERSDPLNRLGAAARVSGRIRALKRHPGLQDALHARVFLERHHVWLVRALLGLLLPRRMWPLRWWLAAPYVERLTRGNPLLAPYVLVRDLIEIAACARASRREGMLVL